GGQHRAGSDMADSAYLARASPYTDAVAREFRMDSELRSLHQDDQIGRLHLETTVRSRPDIEEHGADLLLEARQQAALRHDGQHQVRIGRHTDMVDAIVEDRFAVRTSRH